MGEKMGDERMNPEAWIDFAAPTAEDAPLRGRFVGLQAVLGANRHEEVGPLLERIDVAARNGSWAVGYVSYEAAAAFDPALETHEPAPGSPLAWFALFDRLAPWPESIVTGEYTPLRWCETLDEASFRAAVARIQRAIAEGEFYQLNFTAPVESPFSGDALAFFPALRRAQPGGYALFLDTGEGRRVASVSPELFFHRVGNRILCRPMKGTAPRGISPEEDARQALRLRSDEKERAENVMIVDLIRNDLSRLTRPGGVRVPRLFHTQAWPTVWQMSSDVEAELREAVSLREIFEALFPCGSVTGAPKVRAMHWIRRLEGGPRGVYCGAMGVVRPGGDATFNVPIRTVEIVQGRARCGIGSAITADARARSEAREWRVKRAFLERAARPFQILETMRLEGGEVAHWPLHRARLLRAARHFGHPCDESALEEAVRSAMDSWPEPAGRLRLLLDAEGKVSVEVGALPETPECPKVMLAHSPIDGTSEFVRYKTTRREAYEALGRAGIFDTLLWNESGEITEFTRGNVAVRFGETWYTPPLCCGLLDGVMRHLLLAQGRLVERRIRREELDSAEALAFLNALRGWVPVVLIQGEENDGPGRGE